MLAIHCLHSTDTPNTLYDYETKQVATKIKKAKNYKQKFEKNNNYFN
jgi:hypothetical protein